MTWLFAFVLTQMLELPVYWWGTRGSDLSVAKRLVAGLGASTLTHPILWFVLHPVLIDPLGYELFFVVGEVWVVLVEAMWLRALGIEHALRLAFAANAFSAGVGLLLAALLSG